MSPVLRIVLKVFGFGALVAGGVFVAAVAFLIAVLIGPLVFWLAWNVLNFAHAVGLPELGVWGVLLATLFLVAGWFGKVLITAIVFLFDPSWFQGAAQVQWPEATFKHFIAIALLALLAARPHSHAHKRKRKRSVL